MKFKIIFTGLWVIGLMLGGCSVVPPLTDRYGTIAPLVAYVRHVATLTPELLTQEMVRAEAAFKDNYGAVERIKFALLLGLLGPQDKRNEVQAIRLLDGYINNNIKNEALTDYAFTLRHFLIKQQAARERENTLSDGYNTLKQQYNSLEVDYKSLKERYLVLEMKTRNESENSKERYLGLETKLRDETLRNEALQLKLDTLKAIEESIRRRIK